MKWLMKMMLPKPEKISGKIAEYVQETVNNLPKDVTERLQKTSLVAEQANKCIEALTRWIKDGNLDDEEVKEFERAIRPLVEKVYERIYNS